VIAPCLHCAGYGSVSSLHRIRASAAGNTAVWWVQCDTQECSAEGPAHHTKAGAIEAWNAPPGEVLADVLITEWRGRAEVAERASAHKEHLLTLQSAAFTKQERIVLAVGIKIEGATPAAIYIQSNSGDEVETLARLSKTIGPYMELVALTMREEAGKRAGAALERDRLRRLLADLVAENGDAGMSDAWTAADRFLSGEG